MYMVTMLCNPAKPVLKPATVEMLRNAWGGNDPRWLSPDIAVEFSIPSIPSNRWAIWKEMQEIAVDLVVQTC